MGLRAVGLAYRDPFTRKSVAIRAATRDFLRAFSFDERAYEVEIKPQSHEERRV